MKFSERIKNYHFQIKHLIIFFVVLALFQTILSYINSSSAGNLLSRTMEIYRKDSAETLAHLTTTSLELLMEHELSVRNTPESRKATIREFDIIFSQQALQQNVSEICVLIETGEGVRAIEDGAALYYHFIDKKNPASLNLQTHREAVNLYSEIRRDFREREQIFSTLDEHHTFHVLVPLVPMGELAGALYMKISPDYTHIANEIQTASSETGAIFSSLILLSLLAMFYMSSYTMKERDQAQQLLFEERKLQLKREIEHEKEALFTKRIYHAHHKAEKVMGFIKADIRALSEKNLEVVKDKIIKYANFVSRVIYDMKSYDPPVNVIRNPIFRTRVNEVIRFIVHNIFERVFRKGQMPHFELELDESVPVVSINEYVIWEIIEPLIQNCIDHNPDREVSIRICSRYFPEEHLSEIIIEDDGSGIHPDLLLPNEKGTKKIFLEHTSTKSNQQNAGYGCYLAYEISKNRCGWRLDAENRDGSGARFILTIPHREVN